MDKYICEQCWTHSIPEDSLGEHAQCPICGTWAYLYIQADQFDLDAWCGGNGTDYNNCVDPKGGE